SGPGRLAYRLCRPGVGDRSKTWPLVNAPECLPSIQTSIGILIPNTGECFIRSSPSPPREYSDCPATLCFALPNKAQTVRTRTTANEFSLFILGEPPVTI